MKLSRKMLRGAADAMDRGGVTVAALCVVGRWVNTTDAAFELPNAMLGLVLGLGVAGIGIYPRPSTRPPCCTEPSG